MYQFKSKEAAVSWLTANGFTNTGFHFPWWNPANRTYANITRSGNSWIVEHIEYS